MSLVSALNMVWRTARAGRHGQSSTGGGGTGRAASSLSDAGLERGTESHRDSGDI